MGETHASYGWDHKPGSSGHDASWNRDQYEAYAEGYASYSGSPVWDVVQNIRPDGSHYFTLKPPGSVPGKVVMLPAKSNI